MLNLDYSGIRLAIKANIINKLPLHHRDEADAIVESIINDLKAQETFNTEYAIKAVSNTLLQTLPDEGNA